MSLVSVGTEPGSGKGSFRGVYELAGRGARGYGVEGEDFGGGPDLGPLEGCGPCGGPCS